MIWLLKVLGQNKVFYAKSFFVCENEVLTFVPWTEFSCIAFFRTKTVKHFENKRNYDQNPFFD